MIYTGICVCLKATLHGFLPFENSRNKYSLDDSLPGVVINKQANVCSLAPSDKKKDHMLQSIAVHIVNKCWFFICNDLLCRRITLMVEGGHMDINTFKKVYRC